MRVAVIGPGAVGVTFAAAAEEAGRAVTLCGRRPAPAPVLERPDGTSHTLASPVLAEPAAAGGPADWVLLAVKTHQVAGAAPWLRALCHADTTVAVLQNGVEHEALVAPHAGPAAVLPVIVWAPSEAVAPGRVRRRGDARLSVPDDARGAGLAALLDGGAQVDRVPDFATEVWRKLAMNAVAGLLPVTRRRAEVFHAPGMRELAYALGRECAAVARAEGAGLTDADADAVVDGMLAMPPDLGSSILFDRLAGRLMEWDARNGVVSRLGARHGIRTPVSDVLVPILAALDEAPA